MKILYIGATGDLSLQPLRYLLQSEHSLCAVATDIPSAGDPRLPVYAEDQNDVVALAREAGIMVLDLSGAFAASADMIRELSPDLVLVSCYARKLPQLILDIPYLGCFNFHPSLLPAYRGPVPLFWQFHDGLSEFGVTMHRMSESIDTGDIASQSAVVMPDGVNYARAQQLLAEAYIELMPGFLSALENGSLRTQSQDESVMSYQGFPTKADFKVNRNWSAKRMFNFICATAHYGVTYPCEIEGRVYQIQNVLGYSEELLPEYGCVIDGCTIQIACNPGIVLARMLPYREG